MKLWSKVLQIFLLFSLYFSSLNLKLTKMELTRFAMKLFIHTVHYMLTYMSKGEQMSMRVHCWFFTLLPCWINPHNSSVESQKGTINIQRCSVENQKGAIPVQSLWWNLSVLLVLNGTSLNSDSALLALNWRTHLPCRNSLKRQYFGQWLNSIDKNPTRFLVLIMCMKIHTCTT